jgi:hypothetical protein
MLWCTVAKPYALMPLLLSAACGSAFTATGGDASTSDASTMDAGVEASADSPLFNDGPTSMDGGAGEGGGSSPCGAAHLFCDDFDHGPLSNKWAVDGPCSANNLDPSTSVSPPNSMLALPQSTGTCQRMTAVLTVAPKVRCDLDLDISLLPVKYVEVFRFAMKTAVVYYQVALGFDMANPSPADISEDEGLVDGGGSSDNMSFAFDPGLVGKWVHARLLLDLSNRMATAVVAGVSQGLALTFAPVDPIQTLEIRAGASGVGTGTIAVHFDNVYCDPF